jgi:hypothetical protein
MGRLILAALAAVALGVTTARADWQIRRGEDPMTDEKWVTINAISV